MIHPNVFPMLDLDFPQWYPPPHIVNRYVPPGPAVLSRPRTVAMALLSGETMTRQQYLDLSADAAERLLHEEFDCPKRTGILEDYEQDDTSDWE